MLSYKQWKMLNESFAGSFTLGLAQPTNLGVTSNSPTTGIDLDECGPKMKKMKKSKKMDLDDSDGEMVDPAMTKDDPDVDVEGGDDMEMGDDSCHNCGKNAKKHMKKMKKSKKMWSDEDDDAGVAPAEGDDEGDEEEASDDEGGEEEGDDEGDEKGAEMGGAAFSKKNSRKKSKKNLKKEAYLDNDEQWMASVKNMLDPNQTTRKYDDGFTRYYGEDALFTPVDTDNLTQAVRPEPQAGEVGFAPQQMMGR